MSYWIRWDSSPNRQLIHEIIDAFEDWLLKQGKSSSSSGKKNKKDRKRKGNSQGSGELIKRVELRMKHRMDESNSVDENRSGGGGGEVAASAAAGGGGGGGCGEEEVTDKGSVRRFVSFIGERICQATKLNHKISTQIQLQNIKISKNQPNKHSD